MTRRPVRATDNSLPVGLTAAVAVAFMASGFAALVYEICWIRRSALLFGSTTYAVSTVLAVFFLGLGAGAELGGRLSQRVRWPLYWFAAAEAVVAIAAIATVPLFDIATGLFRPVYGDGLTSPAVLAVVRLGIASVLLLPATLAMGVSLPLLTRHFVHTRDSAGARVGWLYGVNTLGAAAGAAAAGWYLIPTVGLGRSIAIAALVNLGAASVVVLFARRDSRARTSTVAPRRSDARGLAAALFFVSGFCALAFQVIWTRFATLTVQNTVYTYTLVIVLVLAGLVAGAVLAALTLRYFTGRASTAALYGGLQALGALAFLVTIFLPPDYLAGFGSPLGLYALLLLPATVLAGALFPVAVHLVVDNAAMAGHDTGRLYAVNVAGGVAGTVLCGFVLLPQIGLALSARLVALLAIGAGIVAALALGGRRHRPLTVTAALVALAGWWAIPGFSEVQLPADYLASPARLVEVREGVSANVAVVRDGDVLQMEIDGWWQGSADRNHQAMAVHVPMLLHGAAARVLIIGAGAGQAPAGVLVYDSATALDVVDIEPAVFEMITGHFDGGWMDDRRVRLIRDDGRNYVRHTSAHFDVIAIEAGQLHRPGVAQFYTLDFYRDTHAVLGPGGVLSQFVPLPFVTPAELATIVATFVEVFPEAMLWYNTEELLLLGCRDRWDDCTAHAMQALQTEADVRSELAYSHWGGRAHWLADPEVFAAGFLAGPRGLAGLAHGGAVYRDDRPWLEYQLARPKREPVLQALVDAIRRHLDDVTAIGELLPGIENSQRVAALRDINLADIVAADRVRAVREGSVRGKEAEAVLRVALQANELNVEAHRLLGDLLAARGELSAARAEIDRALAIDPDNMEALYTGAFVATREQRFDDAIAILNRLIESKPADANLHNDLGVALVNAGDLYGARASFERALALDPDSPGVRVNLRQVEDLLP